MNKILLCTKLCAFMVWTLCISVAAESPVGSTHFIVGAPVAIYQKVVKPASNAYASLSTLTARQVLFSPDDNLQETLIKLIKHAQGSICIAIYAFTDTKIAQALLDAHKRGVAIEVVIDPSGIKDRSCRIGMLQKHGITVYVYNPYNDNELQHSSLMHNKFVIFEHTAGGMLVWTGSFNFTRAAGLRNQENVVILNDPSVVQRYQQQFERLKSRSVIATI